MDMKFILACVCLIVGYVRSAPTTTVSPGYPWQKPKACSGCQGGSGGDGWEGVTPPPSNRAHEYYVISVLANNIKTNLTNVKDLYLGKSLISNVDKEELDGYSYPAFGEFPSLPSLPTNDVSISLKRAYSDIQLVSSFVEQVRIEHELQVSEDITTISVEMANDIKVHLQDTGLNKLSMEMCCTVTSHGITHPSDVTMEGAKRYAFPHSHTYSERYQRDYLILRDSATVMGYIHAEFKRHHEALI